MVLCLRFLMNSKNYTNNIIITREAGWRYGIMSTVPYEQQKLYNILKYYIIYNNIMVLCLRFLMNSKNYTNNIIITREAGWRYGIMSTVPYEQQKLYNILKYYIIYNNIMVLCLRFLMNSKNYTNNIIITREAGWRYGIMSTVL